jgi:aldehyde:ferredoxin oxidoreductase
VVSGLLWAIHPRDPFTDHHEYAYFQSVSGLTLEEQKAIAAKIYGSPETINPPGKSKYDRHEAEATIIAQNRSYAKNLLSLCEWIWPMSFSPFEDRNPPYIGDTSLESRLLSAVKGWDMRGQDSFRLKRNL